MDRLILLEAWLEELYMTFCSPSQHYTYCSYNIQEVKRSGSLVNTVVFEIFSLIYRPIIFWLILIVYSNISNPLWLLLYVVDLETQRPDWRLRNHQHTTPDQFSRHSESTFAYVTVFEACRVMLRGVHPVFHSDTLAVDKKLFIKVHKSRRHKCRPESCGICSENCHHWGPYRWRWW
jgi:hypothetical protein